MVYTKTALINVFRNFVVDFLFESYVLDFEIQNVEFANHLEQSYSEYQSCIVQCDTHVYS